MHVSEIQKRELKLQQHRRDGNVGSGGIQYKIQSVLQEVQTVLGKVDPGEVEKLIEELLRAKTIVVCGAGRVGMMTSCFGMRLGHLGLKAFTWGDSTVPGLGPDDLLLVSSGSGETQTVYHLVEVAKENNVRIALITGNPDSRMGRLANTIVRIPAPSKVKSIEGFTSIQPMTTLNEQCLLLFFDSLALLLMERMGENHDTMWTRHSNLE